MNSVSLLVFWLLPLLPTGGHGPFPRVADLPQIDVHDTRTLVQQPVERDLPVIRELLLLAATDGDGEGPYEGSLFDSVPAFFPLWEHCIEDDLSYLIHPKREHHRSPSLSLPLLC